MGLGPEGEVRGGHVLAGNGDPGLSSDQIQPWEPKDKALHLTSRCSGWAAEATLQFSLELRPAPWGQLTCSIVGFCCDLGFFPCHASGERLLCSLQALGVKE